MDSLHINHEINNILNRKQKKKTIGLNLIRLLNSIFDEIKKSKKLL